MVENYEVGSVYVDKFNGEKLECIAIIPKICRSNCTGCIGIPKWKNDKQRSSCCRYNGETFLKASSTNTLETVAQRIARITAITTKEAGNE